MNLNRDWSNLPEDILFEIVKNIRNSYIYNLRLRSICYSWRSLIPSFRKNHFFSHQIPFPISSCDHIFDDLACFFSLRESKIYLVESLVTDQTPTSCLIKVSGKIPQQKMIHLNPFFGYPPNGWVPKQVPKSLNLLDFRVSEISKSYHLDFHWTVSLPGADVLKVVLSQTDNRILAIRGRNRDLCSLKLGDQVWTVIRYEKCHHFCDIIHYKGKFYAVNNNMVVLVIDESSLELIRVIEPPLTGAAIHCKKHLVESSGDLFLFLEVEVYKMQENGFTWERVYDLGDQVLLVCDYFKFTDSASVSDFTCFEDSSICFARKDAVEALYGPTYLKDAKISVFKLNAEKRERKEKKRKKESVCVFKYYLF